MNIAVIQPQGHGSGSTTVAALIASELGNRNSQVCLTNTKPVSDSLYQYYGIHAENEKQNVALELVNLIKFGGIKKEKVRNYCRNVEENFDLFVLNTPYQKGVLDESDMVEVTDFLGTNSPYDYVVFDMDEERMDSVVTEKVLEIADVCVLVLSQNMCELTKFLAIKDKFIKLTKGIPLIVVVNKYHPVIGSLKDTAASIGIKNTKNWCLLHSNPYIPYSGNRGLYQLLCKRIRENVVDVVELNKDVSHILKNVMEIKKIERNRRIEARKGKQKQ